MVLLSFVHANDQKKVKDQFWENANTERKMKVQTAEFLKLLPSN